MTPLFMFKAAVLWLVMLLLAVINGVVRDTLLVPLWGQPPALVASGLMLCTLVFAVSWFGVGWLGRCRSYHYWIMGLGWLMATLAFEFTFGLLVAGKTGSQLLAAYSLENGNLWPLVLVVILVSPRLCARLRGFPGV